MNRFESRIGMHYPAAVWLYLIVPRPVLMNGAMCTPMQISASALVWRNISRNRNIKMVNEYAWQVLLTSSHILIGAKSDWLGWTRCAECIALLRDSLWAAGLDLSEFVSAAIMRERERERRDNSENIAGTTICLPLPHTRWIIISHWSDRA